VPVEDVFGRNEGFRRPGSVLSIEPGGSFMKYDLSVNLNVPIAVRREHPQSVTDPETERLTGEPRNVDAASADSLFNLGISYRFRKAPKTTLVPSSSIELN